MILLNKPTLSFKSSTHYLKLLLHDNIRRECILENQNTHDRKADIQYQSNLFRKAVCWYIIQFKMLFLLSLFKIIFWAYLKVLITVRLLFPNYSTWRTILNQKIRANFCNTMSENLYSTLLISFFYLCQVRRFNLKKQNSIYIFFSIYLTFHLRKKNVYYYQIANYVFIIIKWQ